MTIDKGHSHASCLQTCSHDGHVAGRLKGDCVSPTELPTALIHRKWSVIVGAVTHPRHGAYPENKDQPYRTEHERAGEPEADAPVWSEEAGRLALPEAESQGPEPVQAAHLAAARLEVKPTGATAMACSRQRPSKRGSPCQRSWAGASSNDEALPRLHNGFRRGDRASPSSEAVLRSNHPRVRSPHLCGSSAYFRTVPKAVLPCERVKVCLRARCGHSVTSAPC